MTYFKMRKRLFSPTERTVKYSFAYTVYLALLLDSEKSLQNKERREVIFSVQLSCVSRLCQMHSPIQKNQAVIHLTKGERAGKSGWMCECISKAFRWGGTPSALLIHEQNEHIRLVLSFGHVRFWVCGDWGDVKWLKTWLIVQEVYKMLAALQQLQ